MGAEDPQEDVPRREAGTALHGAAGDAAVRQPAEPRLSEMARADLALSSRLGAADRSGRWAPALAQRALRSGHADQPASADGKGPAAGGGGLRAGAFHAPERH